MYMPYDNTPIWTAWIPIKTPEACLRAALGRKETNPTHISPFRSGSSRRLQARAQQLSLVVCFQFAQATSAQAFSYSLIEVRILSLQDRTRSEPAAGFAASKTMVKKLSTMATNSREPMAMPKPTDWPMKVITSKSMPVVHNST